MRRLLPSALLLATLVALAAVAPLLPLADPTAQAIGRRLAAPGPGAWLGRDEFGRDVLSRLVWGARTSLSVAFASAVLAGAAGTVLGLVGGWFRGWTGALALRSVDVVLCFPPILLALLVVTLLGPGAATLILVLSVLFLPGFARVTYGEVLSLRAQDFAEAVRALGAGNARILALTVLPNVAGPVLVQLSLAVAAAVVLESGLSFLGLGVVPPAPSWGTMIRGARVTVEQAPLLLLWPCAALSLTVLCMNLFCDGLRDALDPKRRVVRRRAIDRVVPGLLSSPRPDPDDAVLVIDRLTVAIDTERGRIHPVSDVSLAVAAGETLAVVGESGSGKSVTASAIMGLLPPAARPVAGAVHLRGRSLLDMAEPELRRLRGGAMAMIFQDPATSLNPVLRVGEQLAEAIRAHRPGLGRAAVAARCLQLFRQVGIADPKRRLRAFPHEMSGGMRQRVTIAIALANDPALLIADEPTTALDVTVQAQVLDLLATLKREAGTAGILVSHSLGVVAAVADRVAVMYAGEIVEQGPTQAVFDHPLHPYTAALLAAVPDDGVPDGIAGTVPPPYSLPPGCRFAPRCRRRVPACDAAPIALSAPGPAREVRCIRWDEP